MSDPLEPIDEHGIDDGDPAPSEIAALDALLARAGADGSLWADPPHDLEHRIVTAIEREAEQSDDSTTDSRIRDTGVPWWLGAAAALIAVLGGIALIVRSLDDDTGDSGGDAIEFALAGTEAAPGASARVSIASTPAGLRILLDADGLPGAPEGSYYEAWLSNGDIRVSAGTFHLRGGSNEIELWAGVAVPEFNQMSVTVEPIDGDNTSSGHIVLRGSFPTTTP